MFELCKTGFHSCRTVETFSKQFTSSANRTCSGTLNCMHLMKKERVTKVFFGWEGVKTGRTSTKETAPRMKKGGNAIFKSRFLCKIERFFFYTCPKPLMYKIDHFLTPVHISCRLLMPTPMRETSLRDAPKVFWGTSTLSALQIHPYS